MLEPPPAIVGVAPGRIAERYHATGIDPPTRAGLDELVVEPFDAVHVRRPPAGFKLDLAVDGGVPWSYEPARRAGTVHVGGTLREIAVKERMVHRGDMPSEPFVLVCQQYLADQSRSNGDTHPVYAYAHVPAGYSGDASRAIEEQIERYAPGFRDRILARHTRSVAGMEAYNPNYVGGDVVTGSNDPRQLVFRPRVALDPYSVGIPGVYLCSAATPPGAGAHGMCGYNAARSALRSIDPRRRTGRNGPRIENQPSVSGHERPAAGHLSRSGIVRRP